MTDNDSIPFIIFTHIPFWVMVPVASSHCARGEIHPRQVAGPTQGHMIPFSMGVSLSGLQ